MTSRFRQLPNTLPSKFLAVLKDVLSVMTPCSLLRYYLLSWRWRQQVSPKLQLTRSRLHGVT